MVRQAKNAYETGMRMNQDTVLFSLLSSDLPAEEKIEERLSGEANVFLAAETETTATVLSLCTYHLLKNPDIVAKMKAELWAVVKDPKPLPRCFVLERLRYAMRMSAYLVHTHKRLYPDPTKFTPERWLLRDGRKGRHLERYLLTFSRGSGQCLGMQYVLAVSSLITLFGHPADHTASDRLAYCELYLAIAALTLRVVEIMKLYSTTDTDVV
ncbi:cytochrome P450 monooxygenase SAT11 [Colletotrichum spaethianum]|uniref:Cytochrome P450 monooxygenase SAT11 n=1 Tax=Colletotrichum spaethianum TaxID=700344 RepID=A0AA37PGB0_9PEZI|nr:cytochrome P450 monooxygenase SAT11 [Colletotrichum spaethianum]GKT51709.1 cytochrome P450 monooxygenase SAT11 [Colletotrichum spaethianum]